jgi:hypothetical protein
MFLAGGCELKGNGTLRLKLIAVAALWALCCSSILGATQQGTQPQRLVDYVSPLLLAPNTQRSPVQPKTTAITEAVEPSMDLAPTAETMSSADRWVRFENEYGTYQESPLLIGRWIQSAKYGLDTAVFTMQEAAKRFEFSYDVGDVSETSPTSAAREPQYSMPILEMLPHGQLKSEITIHDSQTGATFIGLKLVFPFGSPKDDTRQRSTPRG